MSSFYVEGLLRNVFMKKPYFNPNDEKNKGKTPPTGLQMVVQLEISNPVQGGEGYRYELMDFNIKKKSDEAEYSALQGKVILLPYSEMTGDGGKLVKFTDSTRRPLHLPDPKK